MKRAATALVLVAVISACGSKAALTPAASQALGNQVAAVRLAAGQQDPVTAKRALDQLRATLAQLEQRGQVSATRAGAILSDAAAVQDQLGALPTPTTAPPPTTSAPPPARGGGKDHGNGNGGGD